VQKNDEEQFEKPDMDRRMKIINDQPKCTAQLANRQLKAFLRQDKAIVDEQEV